MKPKSKHCAECEKRGELCPECAEHELDEGTPAGVIGEGDDAIPLVKFTVIGKKRKLSENEGLSDESKAISDDLVAKDKKSKSVETGERYGDEDLDKYNDDGIKDGMDHLKFLREQLAESEDEEQKKQLKASILKFSNIVLSRHKHFRPAPAESKNKTTSFLDSFNPSRPLGMR